MKDDAHSHDESLQLTAYNDLFEVYAEVTPPVAGDTCEVVAHSTWLEAPTRQGIYKFLYRQRTPGVGFYMSAGHQVVALRIWKKMVGARAIKTGVGR